MDWVEVAFKDVDGAVAVAMTELDVSSREEVEVTVLQEPKPGFLGVGGKEAIVRVTKTGKKRRRRSRGRGKGGQNGLPVGCGGPSLAGTSKRQLSPVFISGRPSLRNGTLRSAILNLIVFGSR